MAVERKVYWLRHFILIAIVVLVLFPIVWLVSTSVRRDQAAFSSNLFSNRVTLQHYRNLLFPERSVGRLILDLQSATYTTGDYRGKSRDAILRTVEKYLAKFDSLMKESEATILDIETGLERVHEKLKSEEETVIDQMREIQLKDLKLFQDRLEALGDFTDAQIVFAAGEVLKKVKPSLDGVYAFYLELLKNYGIEIRQTLSDYERLYEETLEFTDETLGLLEGRDFENKDEVVTSLRSLDKYLTLSGADYTQWRKTEWLKVINKYLKEFEKTLPSEEGEKLERARTGIYETFKEADEVWKTLIESGNSISVNLSGLAEEAFGTAYLLYSESIEELASTDLQIEGVEKKLQTSQKAKTELEDSISVALPTVISETRKLSALIPPLERIVTRAQKNSDPVASVKLTVAMEELAIDFERIIEIYSTLESFDGPPELTVGLRELAEKISWFLDNRTRLLENSGDSEVAKGVDIINVALSNLSRVLPVLKASVADYGVLLRQIEESELQLEELKAKKAQLQEKISTLETEARKAAAVYEEAVQAVYIRGAILLAERKIDSLESARDYVWKVGETMNAYFYEKPPNRYRPLFWFDDFNGVYAEASEGTIYLSELINKMREMKRELAAKVANYIELRFLGTSVTLDDFAAMQETYNNLFQQVNAKYQRASRLISNLLDKPASYSGQYEADLRSVDKALFRANQIWAQKESTYFYFVRWLGNSVLVALTVSLISVVVAALAAYPFSRMRFPGRRQGLLALLLVQMFPSIMFMVALYALLQFLGTVIPVLGLNTLGGLIFVYSGGIAFNIWLIKGYYDTIPNSLEEAAMIDGATKFQAFSKIILPLARPILAVVAILTFMNIFNEFLIARILLQDINKWTYAVGLWQFSGRFETSWGPFTAAALIGAVPMVVFFLVLQDYIVGGLTQGSVKE